MTKPKLLFVYDHQYPDLWQDGLRAALELLKTDFDIRFLNLAEQTEPRPQPKQLLFQTEPHHFPVSYSVNVLEPHCQDVDFILGWGAFGSLVHHLIQEPPPHKVNHAKRGLCIAGNAIAPHKTDRFDVLFYETRWYRNQINFHPNIVQAFGVNTDIYFDRSDDGFRPVLWDYIGVGAFADWKRWERMKDKEGRRLVIGEYQRGNESESLRIVQQLLRSGVMVSPMVNPSDLATLYNCSHTLYMPSTTIGGGERAVLEARACGLNVEVEDDNPKLQELVALEKIPTHIDYAGQLKKGILSCL